MSGKAVFCTPTFLDTSTHAKGSRGPKRATVTKVESGPCNSERGWIRPRLGQSRAGAGTFPGAAGGRFVV